MIANDEWVFIHIPKTSGTNFQTRLIKDNLAINYHKKYNRHFTHQPLKWWEKHFVFNDHKILTIVRNPYTRFLSLYNHIFDSVSNLPEYNDIHIHDMETFIRKDQFHIVNDIIKKEVKEHETELCFDIFWPQYKYIESDNKNVLIFKHETDLVDLEEVVGCKFTTSNYNSRKYNRVLYERYNTYTRSAILSLYKEDFDRWDYSYELF
jgi:hypothetical protein